jgi:hypothetical protein
MAFANTCPGGARWAVVPAAAPLSPGAGTRSESAAQIKMWAVVLSERPKKDAELSQPDAREPTQASFPMCDIAGLTCLPALVHFTCRGGNCESQPFMVGCAGSHAVGTDALIHGSGLIEQAP